MSQTTIASIINALPSQINLNTIDANKETPYSAAKLQLINSQLLLSAVNTQITALKYAHVSKATLNAHDIIGNRRVLAAEYLAITRLADEDDAYVFKIESTINKDIRMVQLFLNSVNIAEAIVSFGEESADSSNRLLKLSKGSIDEHLQTAPNATIYVVLA